ncbi:MAG: hypothetical protein RXS23_01390 [Metallosphaera yellowstonensis]|jgi:hypothetical protein|uniref:Calcium binding protein SSO6904 domain-containing protein n=1 Tax=Metallosphaera yellowstonensis MK1 TaxID=671065 RepID=H2C8K5_9CREN|nr:hypothetical protein [Metallosphaera yellowstonensis]EHP68481.1 hypothetical protein MetMK1DRAFT_00029170 [Metallosphaera yellowstonensis MK1]
MSILDQEEFVRLRNYRSRINLGSLEEMLSELEGELRRNSNIRSSIIFVYANHMDQVKKNPDFFNLLTAIIEKYAPKIGLENVRELILSSLS